ncbi:MAG: 1-acyl-sn-glycerol-3-phosphate acyltransferase [Burkholderiales bacterium]|nr:1-acyl-sn-glycerol-3-phosphate acyltransferase [Burkholderiales bacterium]
MRQISAVLRSSLYLLLQAIITPPYALAVLATFPLPPLSRYHFISYWAKTMVWLARVVLGIRFDVTGRENIPGAPSIIMSKHQSAWETMVLQVLFPPHVYVIKRELLRIPFFGWALALMSPIAIDRGAGMRSIKDTLRQGRERLAQGFSVVIFPEGTRVAPGERGKYQTGGAWLACKTAAPVVPIAHNAGELWGRNALIRYPGLITVVIGAPIDTKGLEPEALTRRVEAWIEGEMARIDGTAADAA